MGYSDTSGRVFITTRDRTNAKIATTAVDAALAGDLSRPRAGYAIGTNIRAGVIDLNRKRAADLAKARVWKFELWRHADEDKKVSRADAVERLVKMLRKLIDRAEKEELKLTPFIGIGCPGIVEEDGAIDRGAQNLAGQLGERQLQPARRSCARRIARRSAATIATILMHNDAVGAGA